MGLFKKKCEYCKKGVDKGKEIFRNVKDPVFIGVREKAFCSEEHASAYVEESANAKKCGSGCCS
jgi:hypothetical protein